MPLSRKNITVITDNSASGKPYFIKKLLNKSTQTAKQKPLQDLNLISSLNTGKLNAERPNSPKDA